MPTPGARTLFNDALDVPPSDREQFIARASAGDADLGAQARRFLTAHASAGRLAFLDSRARWMFRPGERFGKFTISRLIGQGGMGDVYLARADGAGSDVALKVIRGDACTPKTLRRFEREARLLARLEHPGIARALDAGPRSERPHLVMEYVDGVDLVEYARRHALGTADRLRLIAEVCDAVQYAHERGVIHRDLKPSNILVGSQGRPKVLDFGIARSSRADSLTATTHGDTRNLIGTPRYMSPEQCAGDHSEIDGRTDIHALGVIAYSLLCGAHPYRITEDTPLPEIARRIRDEEPRPLPVRDRDLALIIGKAIASRPAHRYGNAADFAADIRRHLSMAPIRARRAPASYRAVRLARRHRAAFAIGAAMLTLVVATAASGWQWRRARVNEDRFITVAKILGNLGFVSSHSPMERGFQLDEYSESLRHVRLDDQLTQITLDRVGVAYQGIGDHEACLPHLREAFELSRRTHGPVSKQTLRAANIYIDSLIGSGETRKAQAIARSVLAEAGYPEPEQLGAVDFPNRSAALRALKFAVQIGKAMHAQRRLDEAENVLRPTLSAIESHSVDIPGPSRYDQRDAATTLALVLIDADRDHRETERLLDGVISMGCGEGEDPLASLELSKAHIALAEVYAETGRQVEAERLLRRMIDLRCRFLLPENQGTRRAQASLDRLHTSGVRVLR